MNDDTDMANLEYLLSVKRLNLEAQEAAEIEKELDAYEAKLRFLMNLPPKKLNK